MVIAEAAYPLDRDLGPHVEASLYESVIGGQLTVEALTIEDWQRVRETATSAAADLATSDAAEAGADGAAAGGRDAATSCLNGFTGDTPVTMADGKQEPISKVKVGDRVLATDPETGPSRSQS